MTEDQRNGDLGRNGRRPWYIRQMGTLVTILITIFGAVWWSFQVHAEASSNTRWIREHNKDVKKIPVLEQYLEQHIEIFEDTRDEQRRFNQEQKAINGKVLDKLDEIKGLFISGR